MNSARDRAEEPARRATIVVRDKKNAIHRDGFPVYSRPRYIHVYIMFMYIRIWVCICMIKHVCEYTSCVCVRVDVNQPVHTGRVRRKTTPGEYNIIIIIISGRL